MQFFVYFMFWSTIEWSLVAQNFGDSSYFPLNFNNEEQNYNNFPLGNQLNQNAPITFQQSNSRSMHGNAINHVDTIEPHQIEPSTIAPCRMNNYTKELECFGPEINDTALENVFKSIEVKGVFRGLKLYKTDVTYLDKQLFFEFATQSFDIDGNHNLSLNSIHRITFVRSKDVLKRFKYAGILYSTYVHKEANDGAIFEIVDGFLNLEIFSVTDTNIPKLQRSVFGRCELISLKLINLARNEIHEVGDYAFYRVPNATCIILKENYIKTITENTFAFEKSSDEVLTLDLSTNLIRSEAISKNAFTRLNRPVILNLHYNLLTYLDEDVFRPILDDVRSSIIVTSNKIACDCKMKWLVSDSHNYIDRVHGLVCGGYEQKGTEIWYFTSYFLESVCNETIESERVSSNSKKTSFNYLKFLFILIFTLKYFKIY